MDLNKHHREALISRRDGAIAQRQLIMECINKADKDNALRHWWNIDIFLLDLSIEEMSKILIKNEIEL